MKNKKSKNPQLSILDISQEMFRVLDLIVAEFRSDPMSVQCFDLSIVKRAENVVALYKKEKARGDE